MLGHFIRCSKTIQAIINFFFIHNNAFSVCRRKKSVKKHRFLLQIARWGAGINDSCVKSRDGKQDSMILTANRLSGRENRAILALCRFTDGRKCCFLHIVFSVGDMVASFRDIFHLVQIKTSCPKIFFRFEQDESVFLIERIDELGSPDGNLSDGFDGFQFIYAVL